jgi:colanic acid/amylovoran biosynthesis protein
MTTIYFAGQDNFGNRGCEALIRSSVKTIKQQIPNAQFLVPTKDLLRDSAQWIDAATHGVSFIEAEPVPGAIRWWGRARRLWSKLESFPPAYRLTSSTQKAIDRCDILVMTGGDIISLDYGLESLYYWSRICEAAMDARKTTILWAGSVGPFTKSPTAEKRMTQFLKRFSLITVRETASLAYLRTLGIPNVQLVADPAFTLDYEPAPAVTALNLLEANKPVLGFNVSPLIRKFRDTAELKGALDQEVASFLTETLKKSDLNVLLIPHVDPLDGSDDNSDSTYMAGILTQVHEAGFTTDRIDMLPRTFNTAQLKDVIRRCTYFMGARTHATVAALSQGVPTTSIAYSVKAKGINQDLFGHLNYVLETPAVTQKTLGAHLKQLLDQDTLIRSVLSTRIPIWKQNATTSAELAKELQSQTK